MNALGRLVFSRFWTSLAVLAAVGEWTLWCWWRGVPAAWPWHLVALGALFALNRSACVAFEVEQHHAPHRHLLGRTLLAVGLTAAIGAVTLGATALVWAAVDALIAFPAQAGLLHERATRLFGSGFDLVAGASVATAMGVALHGYVRGHRRLVVTRLEVPVSGLPAGLDGLRLVHVSDLHVGPVADARGLREAIARANALDPDLVCVTGDVVDSRFADLERWMPELARLQARHGVFAILGNHDREAGLERVARALQERAGWRLLRDDVVSVAIEGERLVIAGFEDRRLPRALVELPAFLTRLPCDQPTVLLVHHPQLFDAAAGAVPLVLAGHTHGGQVAVPGLPRLNPARLTMTCFDAGTFARDGSVLHVSRGLGFSGQRVRIGVPREITLVTLRAADAVAAA